MIHRRVAGALAALLLAGSGWVGAPAAWSAEPVVAATLTSPDGSGPEADLYFLQNGMLHPIGFAAIEAQSRPDGTQAAGTWLVHLGGGNGPTYRGDVTCLSAAGNRAVVGVEGTVVDIRGTPFPFVGLIGLVDGGPPATLPTFPFPWPYPDVFDPPDGFVFHELPAGPAPAACPSPAGPLPGSELWSLLANDVTVVGAPSKEQCKRGGWRALGFENQGRCVASAARGPAP